MFTDALNTSASGLNFSPFVGSPTGSPQAITTTVDSTNVIDVTGAGSGNAPTMIGGFPALLTNLAVDYGSGNGPGQPIVMVFVTLATTVSGTLTIVMQAAPDNGSYSPGTWTIIYQSAALTGSTQLKANNWLAFPVPPTLQGMGGSSPRFYKLSYTVGSSISVTVSAGIFTDASGIIGGAKLANNFISI